MKKVKKLYKQTKKIKCFPGKQGGIFTLFATNIPSRECFFVKKYFRVFEIFRFHLRFFKLLNFCEALDFPTVGTFIIVLRTNTAILRSSLLMTGIINLDKKRICDISHDARIIEIRKKNCITRITANFDGKLIITHKRKNIKQKNS